MQGTMTTPKGKKGWFVRRDGRRWRSWREDHPAFHFHGRTHYEALGKLVLYYASNGDLETPNVVQIRGADGQRFLPCPIAEKAPRPNDINEGPDWMNR